MEIGKYYKSFLLESQLLNIDQHTHCTQMKFPQLSPSSLGIIPHPFLLCLYQEQTAHFVSAVATCAQKVRPEHHVSWKKQALGSEERNKSVIFSLVPTQVISEGFRKEKKKSEKLNALETNKLYTQLYHA